MAKVNTTHQDYAEQQPQWKKVRDVVTGQRAIHKAQAAYLPRLSDEEEDQYASRIARSNFTNFTWRTLHGFQSMMFRKDPSSNVPASIAGLLEDVTMSGVSMIALAKEAAYEVLAVGGYGVLVDHPPMLENVRSLADAQRSGMRPTMKPYKAETIINWAYRQIANQTVLALVVLKEYEAVAVDEFEAKQIDQWRVLDLDETGYYRVRVFQKTKDKDEYIQIGPDVFPAINGKRMTFIPFYFASTEGTRVDFDDPPLIDLVDANLAYYQVNSDRRHGLHFTGLPMLFLAGVSNDTKIIIGSQKAIASDHPDAKAQYIEFTGQGLSAIKDYQAELRQEMAVLGARMLADETKQAVETLGATQIKHSGENSILASIAGSVSEMLEKALATFALFANAAGDISYQLSRDFMPVAMTPQELTSLVGAWQSGAISDGELFDLLKRGDVVDGAKTFEDHQAEIDMAGPSAPKVAA